MKNLIDKDVLVNKIQKLFDEALLFDTKVVYDLMKRMVEEEESVAQIDIEKIQVALKDIHDVADMSRQKCCALSSFGVEKIDTNCEIIRNEISGSGLCKQGHWVVEEYEDDQIIPIINCSNCGGYQRVVLKPKYCCFCGARMNEGEENE